jgi:hemophore-related protein
MLLSGRTARHVVAGVIGAGVVVAATLFGGSSLAFGQPTPAPAPPAPPPPGCTAANLAQVSAGVASATADYLFSHPDVNDFFTSLHGQPYEEMHANIQTYMEANPQVHSDLTTIRQPVTDLRARCEPPPQ